MKTHYLLMIIVCFFFACQNKTDTKTKTVAGTDKAMPKELVAINKKIKAAPTDAKLYFQRSKIYRTINEDSLALRDLEKTISLDTTQSQYFSAIGDLLFDKKDISGSIKWFQRAIEIDPRDETAHLKVANIFLFSKEYPKAFAEINSVLQTNVYNAEAYFLKGLCYKDMGETARAISSFQTAVQTEPTYYDGYMQLGILYTKKKDPLALQYFDNAIKVDSNNMEAHYAKAMFHQTQEQYAEAKKVLKRAIRINRDYAEGHYNIGWMLLQQDSTQKAIKEFERVLMIDPDNARAYYNKGLCYEIDGDLEKAAADYKQALVFNPEFDLPTAALARLNKK